MITSFKKMPLMQTFGIYIIGYAHLFHTQNYVESSILVMEAGESKLIDLMNHILAKYPDLKIFSLPKLDKQRTT